MQQLRVMSKRAITELSEFQIHALMDVVHSSSTSNQDDCLTVNVSSSTKLSRNQKGYVQLKVPVDVDHHLDIYHTAKTCTNKKVQLHQLIAWMATDERGEYRFREQIAAATLEVSHLCHNKQCANPSHLHLEDSYTNKSRGFCECIIYVGGIEQDICRHNPKCVVTSDVRSKAFSF